MKENTLKQVCLFFFSLGLQPEGEPTSDQQKCEEEGIRKRLLTLWYVFVLILITHPPFHCTTWGWGEELGLKKQNWPWEREEEKCHCFCFSPHKYFLIGKKVN